MRISREKFWKWLRILGYSYLVYFLLLGSMYLIMKDILEWYWIGIIPKAVVFAGGVIILKWRQS